jgi:hypothetical protein
MTVSHDPGTPLDLSLVRDDLLFRLQRRIGLIPADGLGLIRRAVLWSLVAWLPVAAWAWYTGRALATTDGEPLLAHFGTHVRFLVAVPLLILAEGFAHGLTTRLLPQFVRSGLVPERELPHFRAALAGVVRLRDASLPWVAIFGLALAVSTLSEIGRQAHELNWAIEGGGTARGPGFGAWWLLFVGRPIYLTLVLSWLWRAVLLFILLRRVAGLDLALVPTHPDRVGGLGFAESFPLLFAPVVLAIGAVLAAGWAHDVVYHGLDVHSLRVEMAAFLAISLALFLSPVFAFAAPLRRAKKQALLDYGALVGRHGRLVHERWIEGRTVRDEPVLAAPELGPVADTGLLYAAVQRMRTVPIGKSAIVPLALAAAAPMIAVLAIQVPAKALLLKLLSALL